MSMNRRSIPAKPERSPYRDIIIAADQADGRAYAKKHGHGPLVIYVTPRSRIAARGWQGPVYATRKARLHPKYAQLLTDAAPCGLMLPRTSRDRRVA